MASRDLKWRYISSQKCLLGLGVRLGAGPACQHKGNLVDEVGNVVSHVERLGGTSRAVDLAKEVACRVDGPAQAHNDAHVVEGLLHGLRHTLSLRALGRLTRKDLEEDEGPASHAKHEADPGVDCLALTCVAEGKHGNGANQKLPEAHWADGCLGGLQDQVELNHLPM